MHVDEQMDRQTWQDKVSSCFAQFSEHTSQWPSGTEPACNKLAGKKVSGFHLTCVHMFDVTTEGWEVFICCHLLKQPSHLVLRLHFWQLKRHLNIREREDGSVSIVSQLWAVWFGVQFLAGVTACSLLQRRIQTGAHPASSSVSAGGYFPRGKVAVTWKWPLTSI